MNESSAISLTEQLGPNLIERDRQEPTPWLAQLRCGLWKVGRLRTAKLGRGCLFRKRIEKKRGPISLQLVILRFGLLQDGDVGIGIFPEGEEVLVSHTCAHAIA